MLPSLTLIGRGRLQPLAHLGHSHSSTKGYKFVPLAGHTATVIPGRKILVFGGQNTESGQLAGLWLLDTVGWEWSKPVPLGTPPAKRSGHSAIYNRDGHVYFFGGWDGIRMRNDFSVLGIQGDPPPPHPHPQPTPKRGLHPFNIFLQPYSRWPVARRAIPMLLCVAFAQSYSHVTVPLPPTHVQLLFGSRGPF